MIKIYINAAHTSFSPGGVWGERTEHEDMLKFTRMLSIELERDPDISCKVFTGDLRKKFTGYDVVLSFHRGTNIKNSEKHGAQVFVQENASADIQYEAFRLLESISSEKYFRMLGVHTATSKNIPASINHTGCERTFLFHIGFIDSQRDNRLFDSCYEELARELSERIKEVFKEEKNEDNT